MQILKTDCPDALCGTPSTDGFYMPGEFEPHKGCIMIWPERPGSWIYGAKAARLAFRNVIAAIAESETVYVAAGKRGIASACEMLLGLRIGDGVAETSRGSVAEEALFCCVEDGASFRCAADADVLPWQRNVEVFLAETDDAWARDVAPTFLVRRNVAAAETEIRSAFSQAACAGGAAAEQTVRAVNWEFNAWGGAVDGLYASWEKDNAFARFFAGKYGYAYYDASPFVLEGGSIHSDGEGTVLVTEACLLSAGRNPGLSKDEIEAQLKRYLGAEKILWLPRGIYQDETNEHVDNVCAFLRPGEVVLAWTEDEADPQYPLSKQCLDYLEAERDARGRKLTVHKLPVPKVPVCITQEELAGYAFAEGEDEREAGERLAASYVNFYFSNDAVVMPVFGGANETSDRLAVSILEKLVPERRVVPVYARDILVGGGNIHCITQQIPAGSR